MASDEIALQPLNGPYENMDDPIISRGDGTLTVTYRVQNGEIHPLELSRHFTASNSESAIAIHGDDDDLHFEYLDYGRDKVQPSPHLIRTVQILPIVCMMLNLMTLLLKLFSSYDTGAMALVWSIVGLVYSLYHIPAAYVGGLNHTVSFGLTVTVSLVVLTTSAVNFIPQNYTSSSFGIVTCILYIVDAVALALVAKFGPKRCRSCCMSCCISCCASCCN